MTWFRSKIDWWLAGLLAIPPLAMVGSLVGTAIGGEGFLISVIACLFVLLLYVGLIFPMRYGIGANELVVRHGLVRQRCALSEILEVHPTRNPLSSPALSLDRLRVVKGSGFTGSIMISPADKAGFLGLLAERAKLQRDGDRLVRAEGATSPS